MELLKADVAFPKLILAQDFRRVYARDLVFSSFEEKHPT